MMQRGGKCKAEQKISNILNEYAATGGGLRNFEFLFRKLSLKTIKHLNVAKGEIRMHFSKKKTVQSLTCEHNKFINIFVIGYVRVSRSRGISYMKQVNGRLTGLVTFC